MAKKKTARRVPRSASPRTYGGGVGPQVETPTIEVGETNGQAARPAERPVLQPRRPVLSRPSEGRSNLPLSAEYSYVMSDLRRLGILAAGTFAAMILLGIIL